MELLCSLLKSLKFCDGGVKVGGFVVDSHYKKSDIFQSLPIFAFEDIEELVDINAVQFVLALGYSNMNEHRQAKFNYCKSRGYKVFTYVSQQAQVLTDKVGEGSIILPGTYIGPYSEVGICTVIRPGTVLAHHDVIGDFNWIADGCTLGGGVKMGSHCFLGLGTTVRNEITKLTILSLELKLIWDEIQNDLRLTSVFHQGRLKMC